MIKKNKFLLIIFFLVFALFVRFYNLNWGAPYYFHPDERNIASSVSQLRFPDQLNPHFFAYGSLPIYSIFFVGIFWNFIVSHSATSVSFEQAIIVSRFFSASFSFALIPLLFLAGKKLKDRKTGCIAAALGAVGSGFIQFAHFGTFEMWLTILSILIFILCLDFKMKNSYKQVVLLGLVFGAAVSTKVSHLALLPLPLLVMAYANFYKIKKTHLLVGLRNFVRQIFLFCLVCFFVFLITNPYTFLDYQDFMGAMTYESSVALGTLPVFYTGEFLKKMPVVFQFLYVYPFLLNPLLTILFLFSFFYLLYMIIKLKKLKYTLLIFFYLIIFISQAFLYVKWTRYMVPTLPFMYLIIALTLAGLWKFREKAGLFVFVLIWGISYVFGLSYFLSAYAQKDTRVAALDWSKLNVPASSKIVSEVYDLGITPFNGNFFNIDLFNFYDLDNNSPASSPTVLSQQLNSADYIILPSQRILKTRLNDGVDFPNGNVFYFELLSQANGFKEVYRTPCDLLCSIAYLNSPVNSFEETASVFDRPTVFIFKRINN